ncbi:MAG TPA: calcium/proton exchanger [Thermoanaerobaculia bacterium]|nr:calcium/proton exchanger [Thermoanaerobaculia bacterium]
MNAILKDLRSNPLNWLLVFVPIVIVAEKTKPESHTLLFALSIAAIVPLAALLSRATESVAAKTGDAVGGLLNATFGNMTELIISIAALQAGMLDLVKASLAGAIVGNSLFTLGGAFLLGGLRYRTQEFNATNARVQTQMLLLASIALLIPSALARMERFDIGSFGTPLSNGICAILLVTYGLTLLFSLKTHKEFFTSAEEGGEHEKPWPIGLAVGALVGVTVVIAVVSEIFVGSVQEAALSFGMSKAFVGFVVVSLVGAAAEIAAAFSGARKNRLDLSIGIAMGSSVQIALFVTPVLVLFSQIAAPKPMDLVFGGGQVLLVLLTTLTVAFVTSTGHSTWYTGVQLLSVYAVFAVALYLIPS